MTKQDKIDKLARQQRAQVAKAAAKLASQLVGEGPGASALITGSNCNSLVDKYKCSRILAFELLCNAVRTVADLKGMSTHMHDPNRIVVV